MRYYQRLVPKYDIGDRADFEVVNSDNKVMVDFDVIDNETECIANVVVECEVVDLM